ncbi:immunity protein Tsi6 family protein [Enterovibrio norvegicus]|uniref:immunity protein Tsi6 family protein n=1 Tax=Enterovibrio norvegicus TaxID=188144 RepID=UPI003D687F48
MNQILSAKQIISERLKIAPDFTIYQSIQAQLDYILSIVNGSSTDRSRLKDINLGIYAVREFEDTDPDLSRSLKEVNFIVYKMTGGSNI